MTFRPQYLPTLVQLVSVKYLFGWKGLWVTAILALAWTLGMPEGRSLVRGYFELKD